MIWREAALVAGKDLRIERRAHRDGSECCPSGPIVLLLFAFALDPDRGVLRRVAPGLFWVTVLLAMLLAVGRAFAIETENGARDALRMTGLDGSAIFLGKAAAIAVRACACSRSCWASASSCSSTWRCTGSRSSSSRQVAATVGMAATGTLYGVLAAGVRARETLVPVLLLPVVAPVMLGATRAWEDGRSRASRGTRGPGSRCSPIFAVLFVAIGMLAFGSLLEEGT